MNNGWRKKQNFMLWNLWQQSLSCWKTEGTKWDFLEVRFYVYQCETCDKMLKIWEPFKKHVEILHQAGIILTDVQVATKYR